MSAVTSFVNVDAKLDEILAHYRDIYDYLYTLNHFARNKDIMILCRTPVESDTEYPITARKKRDQLRAIDANDPTADLYEHERGRERHRQASQWRQQEQRIADMHEPSVELTIGILEELGALVKRADEEKKAEIAELEESYETLRFLLMEVLAFNGGKKRMKRFLREGESAAYINRYAYNRWHRPPGEEIDEDEEGEEDEKRGEEEEELDFVIEQ